MTINSLVAERLVEEVGVEVELDVPLAPYTSYGIGGPAAIWVAPTDENSVGRLLSVVQGEGEELFILGRGSNVLIADEGWPGVTLYIGENLAGWDFDGLRANVFAGTALDDLVRTSVDRGLKGMEPLAGIPGGVGGALRMNAGAFGREIEAVTVEVNGFRLDGRPFSATRNKIDFSYRSAPALEEVVITSASFRYDREDAVVLKKRMEEILALRSEKQPLEFPSCGSVFKRPVGYYAGALIEEVGMKGERVGGAVVSEKHAGFILNTGGASANDVLELMNRIESAVFERFGVKLEREVKLIGFQKNA